MIYPIVAYGDPVLRKKALPLAADFPEIDTLVSNLYETMYAAGGVGLAAPQVGMSLRIFVVDGRPFSEDSENPDPLALKDFKKAFINAHILEENGEPWAYNEGCLSIPDIHEDVLRKPVIRLRYENEAREVFEEEFSGLQARIIQHEYDHIEGVLFIDRLTAFKRQLLKGRLGKISKGQVEVSYRMRFPEAR
ncbi:peptide deformylase [bacterium]|nr:peptide deformylase [bacterium]